ncbi:MAG: HD domain-containing protein [Pseudomonadota bacterium]
MLADIARFALEGMGRADAPYHDADHVVAVSEAARLIVAGRHAAGEAVGVEDWLHMVAAALMHDLGYVRGLCPGDGEGRVMTGCGEASVAMPESATDAWLAPYHVDRGIRVARARYTGVAGLDVDRLARAIDATRFPPPHGRGAAAGAAADGTEPGLVRAADLIGQFADLHYPRKVAALYAEFAETGEAAVQGYASPADIWSGFPAFFETVVAPRIGPALAYLDRTAEGRACRARLELNLSRARAGAPRHVVE